MEDTVAWVEAASNASKAASLYPLSNPSGQSMRAAELSALKGCPDLFKTTGKPRREQVPRRRGVSVVNPLRELHLALSAVLPRLPDCTADFLWDFHRTLQGDAFFGPLHTQRLELALMT